MVFLSLEMKKKDFRSYFFKHIEDKECFVAKSQIENFIQNLYNILFQVGDKKLTSRNDVDEVFSNFEEQFETILGFVVATKEECTRITTHFFERLPFLYDLLNKDAEFMLKNDPAAKSIREIKIAYPGFFAIAVYRFAHELFLMNISLIPRILTEYAHGKTGIDIHPGAKIGEEFFIDHGTGVVIGETTHIGNRVKIYQGVTLGAISVSKDKINTKRHPTIEDDVVIYSGATILGGETLVGHDSIIGGNVWLTHSIEPHSRVFHKSQITVKGKRVKQEPINFVI